MKSRRTLFCAVITIAIASAAGNREELFDQELYQDVLDPELCRQQLQNMRPFEFYDASFRIPQGVLIGSAISLGDYRQCLKISQESATGPIEGKYCMISLRGQETINVPLFSPNSWPRPVGWSTFNVTETVNELKKYELLISELDHYLETKKPAVRRNSPVLYSTTLSLALCIPKACSVGDVLDPVMNNDLVPFSYTEQYCRLPDDKPFSGADYAAIAILSILGFITILSTGYDLHYTFILKEDPKKRSKLYSCCSVYTNTTRLFTFTSNPASLDCLDGMRSISILWIILGHTYTNYLLLVPAVNLFEFFEWYSKKRAIWLLSAEVSVDTFFIMSGLLLVYTSLNKMNQKQLLMNIHWFYLNRLLRVFPLLALGVLLQTSLTFRVTDGPNWWNLAAEVDQCKQYWWSALLHVQNWVNPGRTCLVQTWYLSVDMQLYIVSPILLYWVLGSRRSAWAAFSVGLAAVLTANVLYYVFKDFSDSLYANDYTHTLLRGPPFIIGMICGYISSIVRGSKVRIMHPIVAVGYALALVGSSYSMYQAYPDWTSSIIVTMNYSLKRSVWALSVCWVVFACVCGYGGPINWFLSLKLWKFLARISYAMYIFHYPIMHMHGGSFTMPFYYSMENMWFTFAGVTAYTVAVSVAVCVLVDAPCSTLQKLMMTGGTAYKVTKNVWRDGAMVAEVSKLTSFLTITDKTERIVTEKTRLAKQGKNSLPKSQTTFTKR